MRLYAPAFVVALWAIAAAVGWPLQPLFLAALSVAMLVQARELWHRYKEWHRG